MKNRPAGILIGILLIITGILFYFRDTVNIYINTFLLLITGILFFILYICQNKKWSLILGVYLIYFAIMSFLNIYDFTILGKNSNEYYLNGFFYGLGGFICCPGIIFDIIYIREKKPSQLTAGLSLTVTGLAVIFGIHFFNAILTGIGTSLITDSITSKHKKNTPQTAAGIFIFILGIKDIINIYISNDILITLCLIICGILLILKSILKERD